MNFNEKLKQAMQDLHITQAQVVGMTGIYKSSISQYLSGKNVPTEKRRKNIAVSLGLDSNYFTQEEPRSKYYNDMKHRADGTSKYYNDMKHRADGTEIGYDKIIKYMKGHWNDSNIMAYMQIPKRKYKIIKSKILEQDPGLKKEIEENN